VNDGTVAGLVLWRFDGQCLAGLRPLQFFGVAVKFDVADGRPMPADIAFSLLDRCNQNDYLIWRK
jgi:hypothetical protein